MVKKALFGKYELELFDKFYFRIVKARAERDLIISTQNSLFSIQVIYMEIKHKTKLGRTLLDKIKDMRLI